MKVKPLGDKILVEVLEAEEMTKGGIIFPDTAKEEKTEGYRFFGAFTSHSPGGP